MINRLPYAMAWFISCVIIKVVKSWLSTIFCVNSMTISLVLGSSAAVCSSNSKSFGLTKAAMTKVKACRCPPDKYCVSTLRRFSKPILSSFKAALNSSRSFSLTPQLSPRFAPRFFSNGHIFFNGQAGSRPHLRILENTRNILGTLPNTGLLNRFSF